MEKMISVLFVDDEPDFAESIAFRFEKKGYRVKKISNGKDAVQLIKEEPFDIIFLDILMPEMDGIETLDNIRKFNKDIPVIMLTMIKDEKRISEAMKLGISGFIPKRSSLEELENILEVTLRTHKFKN